MSDEHVNGNVIEELPVLRAITELKGLVGVVNERLQALHTLVTASTDDQTTLHQQAVDHEARLSRLELDFARAKLG